MRATTREKEENKHTDVFLEKVAVGDDRRVQPRELCCGARGPLQLARAGFGVARGRSARVCVCGSSDGYARPLLVPVLVGKAPLLRDGGDLPRGGSLGGVGQQRRTRRRKHPLCRRWSEEWPRLSLSLVLLTRRCGGGDDDDAAAAQRGRRGYGRRISALVFLLLLDLD